MATVIKIEGLQELTNKLSNFGESLQNLEPFLKVTGLMLLESSQMNFKEGGRPAWTPLSPATIRRRKGQGNPKILRDTQMLMTSLAPGSSDIFRLEPLSVEVGTSIPYAGYHQLGEGVPARPFLLVQEEDAENILNLARDEIAEKIKAEGL